MPLKILTESAALAAGPVTYTCSPGSPEDPMLCTRLTKLVIALLKPRWASMRTWAALVVPGRDRADDLPGVLQRGELLRVGGDLGQVCGSQPGGPYVDHDRRVQVLRGEVVLQLERLGRFRGRGQVRGGVVLLGTHQFPGQGSGQGDHDHPEDQHGPLSAPPAGQARDAMRPAVTGAGCPRTGWISGHNSSPETRPPAARHISEYTMYRVRRGCQVISRDVHRRDARSRTPWRGHAP